jgi:DNA-binding CsgD family transcriptional regulator/PAS domain-containing protein
VDPSVFSGAIGTIYNAASGAGTWDEAVARLRALFNASTACFARIGPNLGPDDNISIGGDPDFLRLFIEERSFHSNRQADAVRAAPVGMVYRDQALVEDDWLKRSQFWNEWMAPQDMYGGIACKVLASEQSSWMFDVQRGRGQPAFEASDMDLLKLLAPHLSRAADIRRQIQSTRLAASTLSDVPFGIVLVDASMRIKSMNDRAQTMLDGTGSVLLRKSGRLTTASAAKTAALRNLVVNACSRTGDLVTGVGGDLMLSAPGGNSDLSLAISVGPLVGSAEKLRFVGPHATVFMRAMSLALPAGTIRQARALFGLSPKEASLAASLASGRTLKQAATDNGILLSTARSYMSSIFRKTGTSQQSHLVALLRNAQTVARPAE